MSQKGFAPVLIVILIAVVATGGYFVYTNYKTSIFDRTNNRTKAPALPVQQGTHVTSLPSPSPDNEIVNWKTISIVGEYSIDYPSDWIAENHLISSEKALIRIFNPKTMIGDPSNGESGLLTPSEYIFLSEDQTNKSVTQALNETQNQSCTSPFPKEVCDNFKKTRRAEVINGIQFESFIPYSPSGETPGLYRVYSASDGKRVYTFNGTFQDNNPNSLVNKILSTFKFQ